MWIPNIRYEIVLCWEFFCEKRNQGMKFEQQNFVEEKRTSIGE